jgi:osmotically-inducible protein OsmY
MGVSLAKLGLAAASAAAGAGLAYSFDPARGRRRRAELRDRSRAAAHRGRRAAQRQASYGKGRAEGAIHRLRQRTPHMPEDDHTLVDKVRSEVLGRVVDGPHLTVDATDRVVTLRGQVDDEEAVHAIEREVRATPGVADVVNLLHTPGTPAPNKVDALKVHA